MAIFQSQYTGEQLERLLKAWEEHHEIWPSTPVTWHTHKIQMGNNSSMSSASVIWYITIMNTDGHQYTSMDEVFDSMQTSLWCNSSNDLDSQESYEPLSYLEKDGPEYTAYSALDYSSYTPYFYTDYVD